MLWRKDLALGESSCASLMISKLGASVRILYSSLYMLTLRHSLYYLPKESPGEMQIYYSARAQGTVSGAIARTP